VPIAATSVTVGHAPIVQQGGTLHELRGFGAQFFTYLFGEAGHPSGITPPQLADLQNKINRLKPGHSRVAVRLEATGAGPAGQVEREALMKTIALAQQAGANVNLTWWHGPYFRDPKHPSEEGFLGKQFMESFADVIEEARGRGFDCVTHLTVQNEVNNQDIGRRKHTPTSMAIYNRLYRFLDEALRSRADPGNPSKMLRDSVDFVGGDLLAGGRIPGSDQVNWLKFMQQKMADVLDGYSIHVYATRGDFAKLEGRLTRLLELIDELKIKKPVYVTEYGVRGDNPGKVFDSGTLAGENIEDTTAAAFQHAWFNALAPQCGIVGLVKWGCYRVDGRKRPERDWGMISGAGKQFSPTPTYRVTLLFNRLIEPGWKAAGLARGPGALVSVFAGPAGEQSAVALNRDDQPKVVQINGLKRDSSYFAAAWNRDGEGTINTLARVSTGSNGVARVNVPGSGLVALSTRSMGL
jgi:hypothetical protein